MKRNVLLLMSISLVLLCGCRGIERRKPEIRGGSLSPQDRVEIQSVLKGSKAPIRWIEVSDKRVDVYTGDERGGGIVYRFQRNAAGQLEGGWAGYWD